MEQQLKRKVEGPKEAVEIQPRMPSSLLAARPARANEWYIGGFVGGAFTLDTNVNKERTQTSGPPSVIDKAKDVSLDASPLVGAKGGLCPGFFPNLCAEIEFEYFQPKVEEQFTRGERIIGSSVSEGALIPHLDLSVWNLGLNAVGRMGFLRETGYPLGRRLHLHLGVGPSFVWTKAEIRTSPFAGTKDTDFTVGVQALAGVKYFIMKNLAVFGDYKFMHWDPEFRFSTEDSAGNSISEKFNPSSLNANLFYIGLAFHH